MEKKVQVQVSPELEEYIKKVMKDVMYFLEGWCACSESVLFNRAIEILKKLGLLEEFKRQYGLPKTLYGIRSFLYDFVEFLKEKMPELYEEIEEEVYAEEDEEDEEGVEGAEEVEEGNDIDIETIETLKKGISEFAKKLMKEASKYDDFRKEKIKTAIALSQGKYRIANPEALKGVKKSDIYTILFTYNCFEGTKAILKPKNGQDRILEIEVVEDEEVIKLTELALIQAEEFDRRLLEFQKKRVEEIKKKEKEMKELKEFMIDRLIEKDDIETLSDLLWFYGDLEDCLFTLQKAKAKRKNIKEIAKELIDIYDPEGVLYALYKVDKEVAEELANELNIDFEEFVKEFED